MPESRQESIMDDMGSFRTDVEIENPARPGERRRVDSALVDTGAELSWFPREVLESLGIKPARQTRFRQATGVVVERWTGVAIVRVADASAGDQVVFGEPGDLVLLGSRSLEGLNLVVDPVSKRLIDAGAMPAAGVGSSTVYQAWPGCACRAYPQSVPLLGAHRCLSP